jgi:hypothetical protein
MIAKQRYPVMVFLLQLFVIMLSSDFVVFVFMAMVCKGHPGMMIFVLDYSFALLDMTERYVFYTIRRRGIMLFQRVPLAPEARMIA